MSWKEAADKPVFEIVENSESAHAVRHFGEQLLGINFWKEEPCTCAGVSASTQASVLIDESESQPEEAEVATPRIAVADPTKQDRTIELCVCGKTYTADTKGLEGRSVVLGGSLRQAAPHAPSLRQPSAETEPEADSEPADPS